MFVLVYVALAVFGLYVYFSWWPRRSDKKHGKPIPGPRGWPLVGSAFDMPQENVFFKLAELAKQYGDIFQYQVFGTNIVVLSNSELIRKAFNDEPYKKVMNDRPPTFYGETFLFSSQTIAFWRRPFEGSVHSAMRKEFLRSVGMVGEGKKMFGDMIQTELSRFMESIEAYQGGDFEFQDLTRRFLENTMSVIFHGQPIDDEEEFKAYRDYNDEAQYFQNPMVDAVMQTFPIVRKLPTSFRKHYQTLVAAKDVLHRKIVEPAKAASKEELEDEGYVDFMVRESVRTQQQQQPDSRAVYTDDRISPLMQEAVVGGIITTLSHVSATMLLLSHQPELQAKLQAEVDTVIGRDTLPSLEDKENCPYAEAVAMETRRYVTSLPGQVPHLCNADIEFEGYHISKGSLIFPNQYEVMHDERVWGDPWTYRPDRWLDDNGQIIPYDHPLRKHWMPFGTGRRQCVGENLSRYRTFLVVTTLLQRWNFLSPASGETISSDPRDGDVLLKAFTALKPFKLRVVPRTAAQE